MTVMSHDSDSLSAKHFEEAIEAVRRLAAARDAGAVSDKVAKIIADRDDREVSAFLQSFDFDTESNDVERTQVTGPAGADPIPTASPEQHATQRRPQPDSKVEGDTLLSLRPVGWFVVASEIIIAIVLGIVLIPWLFGSYGAFRTALSEVATHSIAQAAVVLRNQDGLRSQASSSGSRAPETTASVSGAAAESPASWTDPRFDSDQASLLGSAIVSAQLFPVATALPIEIAANETAEPQPLDGTASAIAQEMPIADEVESRNDPAAGSGVTSLTETSDPAPLAIPPINAGPVNAGRVADPVREATHQAPESSPLIEAPPPVPLPNMAAGITSPPVAPVSNPADAGKTGPSEPDPVQAAKTESGSDTVANGKNGTSPTSPLWMPEWLQAPSFLAAGPQTLDVRTRDASHAAKLAEALAAERKDALDRERKRSDLLARELVRIREELGALRSRGERSLAAQPTISMVPTSMVPTSMVPSVTEIPRVKSPAPERSALAQAKPEGPLTTSSIGPVAAPVLPALGRSEAAPASPMPSPVPSSAPTVARSPSTDGPPERRLLDRAQDLLKMRDVSGARLLLERAESAGSSRATLLLAQTYDPRALSRWGVVGISGDPARAEELYAKARAAGASDPRIRTAP